jgi:hypothetical protein
MERKPGDIELGNVIGSGVPFRIPYDPNFQHIHVVGSTGVGKSKLIEYICRQTIKDQRQTGMGMMLIDPHGSVYENVMAWLAKADMTTRPIIPINPTRRDTLISYNVLRPRKTEQSVVVDSIVDAMAYVWGASGTDDTPLFEEIASDVFHVLYERGLTLSDALLILHDPAVRKRLTDKILEPVTQGNWDLKHRGRSREDVENDFKSTIRRLGRFSRSSYLRPFFGVPEVSLDLDKALAEGAIILVNLSREKGCLSAKNANLIGTMLLNDLWTAATERGKPRDAKLVTPFRLIVDEFQRFISPTISEDLDEARGYGIQVVAAHQSPKQLRNRGENGERLYDAMMENAKTKIVFNLSDEENLRPLANWLFMGTFDPDEVKLQLRSRKVMEYREELRAIHGYATSHGSAVGSSRSITRSAARSMNEGNSLSNQYAILDDRWLRWEVEQTGFMEAANKAIANSESESESDAESLVNNESTSQSVSHVPFLRPVFGDEISHVQFRSLDDQLRRAMAALYDLEQRQCVVRMAGRMKAPVTLFTPTVAAARVQRGAVDDYASRLFAKLPFAMPFEHASAVVAIRHARLRAADRDNQNHDEPETTRKRIPHRSSPNPKDPP